MGYLSPQIEVLARKKKQAEKSLIKKEHSCGIFQDYGSLNKEEKLERD
ncbi:hypothetical protein ACU8V7_26150 [Zobellia nedashkovskayae]|nr:hypothetical protein [Zobellia nedashkovskayae]